MTKYISHFFLFLLAGILYTSSASAGFINGGTFKSDHLRLYVKGTLENNGSLIGTESAEIGCTTFTGSRKGLVKAPVVILAAEVFNYQGTIECWNKCTIYVKESFDENMFIRQGGGEFEIHVLGDLFHDLNCSIDSSAIFLDCCMTD